MNPLTALKLPHLFLVCLTACTSPAPLIDASQPNEPPTIVSLDLFREALPGIPISLGLEAQDPEGAELTIRWVAVLGDVDSVGETVTYTAPDAQDSDTVKVEVDDGATTISATIDIAIGSPTLFTTPTAIASTEGNSKTPVVACLEGGTVHAVWHDFTDDPTALYHARLQDGIWTTERLVLSPDKSIFPELVPDGESLHLLWQIWRDESYTVLHSVYNGTWGMASEVGVGERVSAALDDAGRLHALFFRDDKPAHAIWDSQGWSTGDAIELDHPYVNTFRVKALATEGGIEIALATSPGGTGYDIRTYAWSSEGGWSSMQTLYSNIGYASDEPDGAVTSALEPHWVWTEQSVEDVWTMGVVEMTAGESEPRWVTTEEGFSGSPSIVFPPDDQAIVAWTSPASTIALSRYPYDERIELGGQGASSPRMAVDREGFTHLVFYGLDGGGIQQPFYSTNRPRPE